MSRIKIVATLGPRTATPDALAALAEAGMDVARLNGSHADLGWHAAAVRLLREVVPRVPVLFDLPGRKIRTGTLPLDRGLAVGDTLILTTAPADVAPPGAVPVTSPDLHLRLSAGDAILADDGRLRFVVVAVQGREIHCRVETGGVLGTAKGINVPSITLGSDYIPARDRDFLTFAVEQGIDFVGISFVECSAHVEAVRATLGRAGPHIVAKIENQQGLDHLAEVADAADALMIDRGDLSVETTLEHIALLQKRILATARQAAKPVIVATEMLHSMVEHATPSKAEISDITNAVLDGASALMLSAETSVGRYPLEAVRVMRRVANAAAAAQQAALDTADAQGTATVPHAMAEAIRVLCRRLPITKIVAVTLSGYAARMVAAQGPRQPILAVTNDPAQARSFNLLPGTTGIHVDIAFSRTSTDHIVRCLETLWRRGWLEDGDTILVTSVGYPKSGNRMNLIETHAVSDLKESLGWTAG